MDIIVSCNETINNSLRELEELITDLRNSQSCDEEFQQTQSMIDNIAATTERDKNLDRIFNQQAHLKMLIKQDDRIKLLRELIENNKRDIDMLRKQCSEIALQANRNRQELLQTQAKEQMKHINDDFRRHRQILELRKSEKDKVRKEIETEESGRTAYLADFEKKLDLALKNRQQLHRGSGSLALTTTSAIIGELTNPDHIELASIDEYAPYGPTSSSRRPAVPKSRRGATTRGRGRKRV